MVCDPWDGSKAPFCFSTIWYSACWGGNLPLWTRGRGKEAFGFSDRVTLHLHAFRSLKETPALSHFDYKMIWKSPSYVKQYCVLLLPKWFCKPFSWLLQGNDYCQQDLNILNQIKQKLLLKLRQSPFSIQMSLPDQIFINSICLG